MYEPRAFSEEQKTFGEPSVNKVIQYCVSGPDTSFNEPVGATMELSTIQWNKWELNESEKPGFWDYKTSQKELEASYCGLFFKTKVDEILISTRASKRSIEALSPISILCLKSGLATNDNDGHRKRVVDTFSFIFGRKILPVGVSWFDEKDCLIRSEAQAPYSPNFNREVKGAAWPSWYYYSLDHPLQYQQVTANKLFELFWDSYEKYELDNVMTDYWAALAMPIGPNLVRYSAALEQLINNWFKNKANKDKRPGTYIDAKEFKETICPLVTSIESKESVNSDWKNIRRNIKNANSLTSRDKQNAFFDLLGLRVGLVEKEAMSARNSFAHGASHSTQDYDRLNRLSYSFKTLFHRVLLKVIGYEGQFIDYSAYDFPPKNLSEPLGGPNDNEQPFEA